MFSSSRKWIASAFGLLATMLLAALLAASVGPAYADESGTQGQDETSLANGQVQTGASEDLTDEQRLAHVNLSVRAKVKGKGWMPAVKMGKTAGTKSKKELRALEFKYRDDDEVEQILEVKYRGGSKAQVVLRTKKGSKWKTALKCNGYVGSRGVGKTREGLSRTPSGDFEITSAFGIKSDPGALLSYVKVTDAMYWCGDSEYYNQLIDINDHPHDCEGEHLIDYSPHYNYGLFFDYNTHPIRYGAGSAFFVHCTGGSTSTAGCIAVSESNMVKIIRKVGPGARLCIYRK